MSIKINPKFKSLIPPLTADEYKGLEESILSEGCRDALVLWNDIIVDGHNRYEICTKHGIDFKTVQKEFDSEDDAVIWIAQNQLGRRNLNDYQRTVLSLKLEPAIAEKAKENQRASGGAVPQKSAKPIDTRDEIAKIAGVSHDTVRKVKAIEKEASPEIKKMLDDGDISINKAFLTTKGITDKSPQKIQKEIIEKADAEREEFKNRKAVSFGDIEKDKKNRGILARNLYSRCLRMGTNISEIAIIEKETNISIEEMRKELSSSEIESLRQKIKWWINTLSQIERRL